MAGAALGSEARTTVAADQDDGTVGSLIGACGLRAAAVLFLLLWSSPAGAAEQQRPTEDDLFGAPATAAPGGGGEAAPRTAGAGGGNAGAGTGAPSAAPPAPSAHLPSGVSPAAADAAAAVPATPAEADGTSASSRDLQLLGDPGAGPRLSEETAPEDPLRIGGQLYLRSAYAQPGSVLYDSTTNPVTSRTVTFSAPSLVDAYFDARPNDRVRGFVLGRMFFDPTLPTTATTAAPASMGTTTGTLNPTVPLISGVSNTRGPSVVLDQLWLRFDIGRKLFVTAGRQHVRWGTGQVWSPTDFLHPVARNPVAAFDARPGFTMLKLHFPWEERGWNFYAFALVEGVRRWDVNQNRYVSSSDATENLRQVGGAARAELVFGTAELGLDIVAYSDRKARYGGDLSFGIGDFDLYVDAGLAYGSQIPRVDVDCATTLMPSSCVYYSVGIKPQVVVGGTYSLKYNDNDVLRVIGEYFYNSRGYSDPRAYPLLFATGTFDFFYTGRHYAAVSAFLPAPWSWNYTNFTATTLGNLSDQSFISRLDYSHTLLTHLSFEAFGAVNYGRRAGEFRLGFD
ncbi:MAG: hypothetical protein ABIS92_05615, partial [Polyangia bacterium]